MNAETRQCQNCKQSFTIELEDFQFYEKMKVPPPTFCPECRMIRRMTWRNERSLYKRKCKATEKDIISMFSPAASVVVYERDYWWSDTWDQLASGREYDFSKPFFTQFAELLESAPLPNLANTNCPGTEYGNHNVDCKNCYLISASLTNENILYGRGSIESKDSVDVDTVLKIAQCYHDILCGGLHRVNFSYDSDNSMNSDFLIACKNLTNCLGCINVNNKSYYIFNEPHTKEEYEKARKKYDFGSYRALQDFKKRFREFILKFPRRYAFVVQSVNTTGDNVINAKNSKYIFDALEQVENVRYAAHIMALKDSYDCYGAGRAELLYEVIDTGLQMSQAKFSIFTHTSRDVQYTYGCHGSSHLFGCVGLRNKQYCILNKQYDKQEYEKLVPQIIEQMKKIPYRDKMNREYRYGEFFPSEISPFAYNETIAQEYYPSTKEKAESIGHRWYEPLRPHHEITKRSDDLSDHIVDIGDDILNNVIECAHKGNCVEKCTEAFRIIPQELQFYRQMNIALPRLCPNCRHYERLAFRNPLMLWRRICDCAGTQGVSSNKEIVFENTAVHFHGSVRCPNEFETAYAPERKEMLYCQTCYNAEFA